MMTGGTLASQSLGYFNEKHSGGPANACRYQPAKWQIIAAISIAQEVQQAYQGQDKRLKVHGNRVSKRWQSILPQIGSPPIKTGD